MNNERELKFKRQLGNPIEVLPNGSPEKLGEHYVNLIKMQNGPGYRLFGETVETRFETNILPNGNTQIVIIEEHY